MCSQLMTYLFLGFFLAFPASKGWAQMKMQAGLSKIETERFARSSASNSDSGFAGYGYQLRGLWFPYQEYLGLSASLNQFFLQQERTQAVQNNFKGYHGDIGIEAGIRIQKLRPSVFWSHTTFGNASLESDAEGIGSIEAKPKFQTYGFGLEWLSMLGIGLQLSYEQARGEFRLAETKDLSSYVHRAWRVGATLNL